MEKIHFESGVKLESWGKWVRILQQMGVGKAITLSGRSVWSPFHLAANRIGMRVSYRTQPNGSVRFLRVK